MFEERRALAGIGRVPAECSLGLAGGSRRVRHRRAALVARGSIPHVRRGGRHERVGGDHAVGCLTIEHQHVGDLGDLRPDALEERGVLGVDPHRGRVTVVDDVGRLLVGQSVVQWHRRRTDLARGVRQLDDARRVLAAPHDLVARPNPQLDQDMHDLIRPRLELGIGQPPDVTGGAVVDDGELVWLVRGVRGVEIPHPQFVSVIAWVQRVGQVPTVSYCAPDVASVLATRATSSTSNSVANLDPTLRSGRAPRARRASVMWPRKRGRSRSLPRPRVARARPLPRVRRLRTRAESVIARRTHRSPGRLGRSPGAGSRRTVGRRPRRCRRRRGTAA